VSVVVGAIRRTRPWTISLSASSIKLRAASRGDVISISGVPKQRLS
jgi:hypothetical protein